MKKICKEDERLRLADQLFELLGNWYGDASQLGGDRSASFQKDEVVGIHTYTARQSSGEIASSIFGARRARDEIFGHPEIFGEPAWEMLLDLAVAEADGNKLSVTALCIGSCSAPTTALRYIKAMEKAGILSREEDQADARRTYVKLSDKGKKMFQRFNDRIAMSIGRGAGGMTSVPEKLNMRALTG